MATIWRHLGDMLATKWRRKESKEQRIKNRE